MRRSRWAEPEEVEEVRDEPVTITEKQYRALKRGALAGMIGLTLGVAATGLAAWSLVRSPEREASPSVAQAASHPELANPGTAQASTAPDAAATQAPAPATQAAAPAPAVSEPKPAAPKPTVTASRKAPTSRTTKASSPAVPVEKPEPQPASSVLGDTPAPTPVSPDANAPKPVGSDPGSTP